MRATGRTGWYLRVLKTGKVPVDGPLHVVGKHPAGLSVLDTHRAMSDRHLDRREVVEALARLTALAEGWRVSLADRLAATDHPE